MTRATIQIIIKIAVITAGVIILFQLASLLFIYKYFRFDYYLSAVALFFLAAGYIISKYRYRHNTTRNNVDPFVDLSLKEQSILRLIVEGKSNKEIAAINFVEVSTIKTHINNIYTKLGLDNRKQAIHQYKDRFIADEQLKSTLFPPEKILS